LIDCIHQRLDRIGPEKGVIHMASGAVGNALWDMYARSRNKPLWKLVVDFTPARLLSHASPHPRTHLLFNQEEFVRSATFRYISDAVTKDEALKMLRTNSAGKDEREAKVREIGCVFLLISCTIQNSRCNRYPAYVTSAGWLGN
jgi:L-fuconate dehydratase